MGFVFITQKCDNESKDRDLCRCKLGCGQPLMATPLSLSLSHYIFLKEKKSISIWNLLIDRDGGGGGGGKENRMNLWLSSPILMVNGLWTTPPPPTNSNIPNSLLLFYHNILIPILILFLYLSL